jgi:hypothetical protein
MKFSSFSKFAILLAISASTAVAATQTSSDTQTLSENEVTFTFNQFNPTLGTLSAVDLIINSSVPSGAVSFAKGGGGSSSFTSLLGGLSLYDLTETYFDNGTAINLAATPNAGNGTFTSGSALANRTFTLAGGQSLISSIPTTSSISSLLWGAFTGAGQIQVNGIFNALGSASGSNVSPNYSALAAPTSVTVQYTYTVAPAPVPEPGQVAASLLLLGGIGAYVFIKRRKKSAPAAV